MWHMDTNITHEMNEIELVDEKKGAMLDGQMVIQIQFQVEILKKKKKHMRNE